MPEETPVLDDFDRDDAATLGDDWSLFYDFGVSGGNEDLSIISNAAALGASGEFTTYVIMYWDANVFGPACETYMTLTTIPGDAFALLARGQQPGATCDGYYFDLRTDASPDEMRIYRLDNGVSTQLGATVTQTVVNGQKLLFECKGNTLKGWHYASGAWNERISRTDSTYGDAGYIGFYGDGNSTAWRYNDFGGGNLGFIAATVGSPQEGATVGSPQATGTVKGN